MARLLLVHHSPTPSLQRLVAAVADGSRDEQISGVELVVRPALEATAGDVLATDGYLLVTGANFGYMSGGMKLFFDTVFLDVGGALDPSGAAGGTAGTVGTAARRPYGLLVHGRYDVTGAVRSVQAIVGALGWRQAAPVMETLGDVTEAGLEAAYELGATLAAVVSEVGG